MSTVENVQAAEPEVSSFKMIYTLGGVAMLSGFLLVLVFNVTKGPIAANKKAAIERAVFQVLPGAEERRTFQIVNGVVQPLAEGENPAGTVFYCGYDASGAFRGVALPGSSQGYADIVKVLYGYSPEKEIIIGMTVLESKETPGLGDRVTKDPVFLENFTALDARLADTGDGLAHDIVTVKHGAKENPWEIDGIAGATISSKTVGRALNASAAELLPVIRKNLDVLKANQ